MNIQILRRQNADTIRYDLVDFSVLFPQLSCNQVFPIKNVIVTNETVRDYHTMVGCNIETSCIPTILLGVEKSRLEQIFNQQVNIVYV